MANKYTTFVFISDTHAECITCKQVKEHSEFHKDGKNKYRKGLLYNCKECACAKSRKQHALRMQDEGFREKRRDKYFIRTYGITYGITLQQRNDLILRQDGKCAICKVELDEKGTLTHLDHCHATGQIRGVLCTNCNRGLGHFKDSLTILEQAIEYLKSRRKDDDNMY